MRRPEPSGPPEPPFPAEEDARLFAEEGSAEGCASGECIPAPEPEAPEPEPDPVAPAPRVGNGRDNPNLSLPERWRAAVETVKSSSPRHGAALANGRMLSMRAGEIILGFAPQAGFHKNAVTSASGKSTVDAALADHFGRPVKLTIQDIAAEPNGGSLSIAEQDAQSRAAHEKSTEGKVRNHPSVRAVLRMLGGEIEHIQVLEAARPAATPLSDTPEESP
ncbi:DNA polymerase III subunit gamma/tau [Corallococcus sp. M34]|nr:DNA polymerase III subunit gamma/tau [Citreicoccus inhibens]